MAANTRAFTSSVEVLTLGKGVYAFTVKTASPQRMGEDGGLLLPAVHIGVGPGVPEEQVEFMSGRRNGAGWIYDHRDVLVLKINTPGTHILISTLRAPDMAALHVNVEKMDATRRGQAKPAPPLIPQTPPPMQLPNYPSAPRLSDLQCASRKAPSEVSTSSTGEPSEQAPWLDRSPMAPLVRSRVVQRYWTPSRWP